MFESIKLFINRLGKKMISATNSVIDVSDKRYIELKISAWKGSLHRTNQIKGEMYYRGIHDILKRKRQVIGEGGELVEVENLPNNKIVDNQYAKMVDQKKNYLLGQPIVFDSENKIYNDALHDVFNKRAMKTIKDTGGDSIVGGIAWIHPYYDEQGNFKFKKFPAYEILPFWADKSHTQLNMAVRYYLEEKEGGHDVIEKVEIYTPTGIFYYTLINNTLFPDPKTPHRNYLTLETEEGEQDYNWTRVPLIPFKFNSDEQPLICRCKSIQDAINTITSDFVNGMEENAGGNSIIVIENYDGENLGEFRDKLSKFRAVKVRSSEGSRGDVRTLEIKVDSTNYDTVLKLLKRQLIENCRGFDAKDERMSNNPNQMNIKTALADLDNDAHDMEAEYQSSFDDLLWFVNQHLANMGVGNFENEEVDIIFNRDSLVNETEIMQMLTTAGVRIPNRVLLEQVPFIDDPDEAEKLLDKEDEKQQDVYGGTLPTSGGVVDGEEE